MSDAQPQRKRKRAVLEAVQEDGNSKFARALGSVDYQTREKGLTALTTWLSKKHDVSELEMKKLWKGIFYCFWHADRPAFQVHRRNGFGRTGLYTNQSVQIVGRVGRKASRNLASSTTKCMF